MDNIRLRCLLATALLVAVAVATSCTNSATPTRPPTLPSATAPVPASATTTNVPTNVPAKVTPSALPAATSGPTQSSDPPAAARINGQAIALEEFEKQVSLAKEYLQKQQSFDPATPEGKAALAQLRGQVLAWMIDQALIDQAAGRESISISATQVDSEVSKLAGNDPAKFEEWLKMNGLTREGFRLQLQRELFGAALQERLVGATAPSVEQVHARHILVNTEAEGMSILIKLRSGESFANLATQYSQDKGSAGMGGDLGFFPRGIMLQQIELVAFALDPGQTSGVFKTDFGYHIIQVVEKDPARKISDEMLPAWRQSMFLRWLETQRTEAKIEYLVPLE